jgi:hypothetical protein
VGNVIEWDRYQVMSLLERAVFWGIYVGPRANSLDPPGIFNGSVARLAEDSRLGHVDTQNAINRMVDRGLAEIDRERRVIRLTEMPDRGNRPANGKCVYAWWRMWQEVPECELKYRHIELLEWLTKPFTKDHLRAWDHTFGTECVQSRIRSNPERPREQQSLFPAKSAHKGVPSVISGTSLTVKPPPSNEINDIPNRMPIPSVSVSVGVSVPVEDESDADSPESDSRAGFSILDLVSALGETAPDRVSLGPPMSDTLTEPLRHIVEECHRESVTLDDVRLAGSWLAAGGLGYRDDLGMKWLVGPGNLFDVIGHARKWDKRGRPELAGGTRRRTGGHHLTGAESYPSGVQAI